jgi:hypothetical protein
MARQNEVMELDRCPSCGARLGEIASTRYRGNLTVIRYYPEGHFPDDEDPIELEHVCGD